MKLTKKGFSLSEVPQLVIVFLIIALVLGVGATVLTSIQSTQCTYGYSETYGCLNSTGGWGKNTLGTTVVSNITGQGLSAQKSLGGWQGTWIVIVAASVILGVIYKYMMM